MPQHSAPAFPVSAAPPAVVRLAGPEGMVAAVPQYLGFHPSESLVLLCLNGPRCRVGPAARVDLFEPGSTDAVHQLVGCAVRYADAAAVVCYHQGARPPCLDELLAALRKAKVPVFAVLSVSGGLIRDASSAAAQRADPGVPVPGPDDAQVRRLAAASVLAGRQVLPDRQALRASVAAPRGDLLGRSRKAIRAVLTELADQLASPMDLLPPELSADLDRTLAQAFAQYSDTGCVAPKTAARLAAIATHIGCRDHLIARAVGREDPAAVPVLISVAGQCPDPEAAEICAVLAVVAYRYGDGALAQCAVDRTLHVKPRHRLAHLMLCAMSSGLPPRELAGMADLANGPGSPVTAAAVGSRLPR